MSSDTQVVGEPSLMHLDSGLPQHTNDAFKCCNDVCKLWTWEMLVPAIGPTQTNDPGLPLQFPQLLLEDVQGFFSKNTCPCVDQPLLWWEAGQDFLLSTEHLDAVPHSLGPCLG
mmetsp:Transcript_66141/g.156217  ORF Transcript_66141/g.156217 Transcript_66141/m.156217 type:complete len:114 (-) Transcript_66141:1353-1694(-)